MPKPYRSDGKKIKSALEMKREEVAKKKAEIIRGQNSQTAAATKKSYVPLVAPKI